jgi:sugar lactone lactonase YvrE
MCWAAWLLAAGPAAAQDMPLADVLLPGEGWHLAAGDFPSVAGLAGDGRGSVYVADPREKLVWRIDPEGTVHGFARTTAGVHGLAVGPDGNVYACQPESKRLVVLLGEDRERVLAEGLAVEDVAVSPAGDCYCTVPAEKAVYLVGRDGSKKQVDAGIAAPGGIVLWAGGGTLVVGDAAGSRLYAFRVGADGGLSAREGYYAVRTRRGQGSGVSGLTVDDRERLYAATREGVQVFDPTGRLSGVLLRPPAGPVTAVAFGGAGGDRLYVACDDRVYVRKTRARGLRAP